MNGRRIDQCVARDTFRCYMIEKTYSNVKVYTINKCTDAMRMCDNDNDPFNISCDVGTHRFLKLIAKKSWQFGEIYLDTIRMQKTYVEHNFGKNFFNNLATLRMKDIVVDDDDRKGCIYLPFNPHFFHMVHTNPNIENALTISYLKECDLNEDNHKLSFSIARNNDFHSLTKCLNEENRHITTTKKEILNYDLGTLMTKERCLSLLNDMGDDTSQICYIVLTNRPKTISSNIKLTNYNMSICNFCIDKKFGLLSKLIKPIDASKLVALGTIILKSLVYNLPDSLHGISIVADTPECNNAMLNVKRPGVLRQYYGKDIASKDSVSVERVAYRSNVSIRSEGSDPYKLIIKPFPQAMEDMASYIYNLIVENKSELDLHDVDISNHFNSCTVLLYHALTGYKPASSMGWHCDNKFSINGNFSQISNG